MYNQSGLMMSQWLSQMQNSMAANGINFMPSTDLTIKQPFANPINLTNFQAASSSAGVLGNLFETSAANGLNGSASMLSGLGNLFSGSSMMSSMPMANMSGIGMPPLDMIPFIFGMGGATGAIDPNTAFAGISASTMGGMPGMGMPGMDMTSLMMGMYGMPGMGMPGMTGATAPQGTDADIAALMKKMPVVSAAKTESILTQSTDIKAMWGGVNKEVSLMSADDSKFTLLNAALPDASSKAGFITDLSTSIDKEVRLAGRGASKEVVAEVFADKLYSLYAQKNPDRAKYDTAAQKEKILSGLKDICAGKVEAGKNDSWGQVQYNENVQAALQILPIISNKENNPNNQWNSGGWGSNGYFSGFMGMGGGNSGNSGNPVIKMLQQTTDNLTATAHDNLVQRNALG